MYITRVVNTGENTSKGEVGQQVWQSLTVVVVVLVVVVKVVGDVVVEGTVVLDEGSSLISTWLKTLT